jgi:hypothetical protein
MAHGSAALFALRRGALAGRGRRLFAAFELAAMQGLELGLELADLLILLLGALVGFVELAAKFCELVLIIALQAAGFLIALPDPVGGQALQVGAGVPVRADEVWGRLAESGHRSVRGWGLE